MVLNNDKSISIPKCQGYVWKSNKTEPMVYFDTECNIDLKVRDKVFIVEAFLCDGVKSYSIKYLDGKYYYKETDLRSLQDLPEEVFVANARMKGIECLKFKRVWKAEMDGICNGFEILKPVELVFCGLETK